MKTFFEWVSALPEPFRSRPWCILGKGPSFSRRRNFSLSAYNLLGLNHVCTVEPVLVTHFSDMEVVDQCGSALAENSNYVVAPWYPHVNFRAGRISLPEWAMRNRQLRELNDQSRLLSYISSLSRSRAGFRGPIVRVKLFGAVAAVNLLAAAGVKRIYSLGIDGGTKYSPEFSAVTLLANGRSSFDGQFREIDATCRRFKIVYTPMSETKDGPSEYRADCDRHGKEDARL